MTDQPEIAPCPFCGGECWLDPGDGEICWVACTADCQYCGALKRSKSEAIAAHNRIATAIPVERVREAARQLMEHHAPRRGDDFETNDECRAIQSGVRDVLRKLGIDLRRNT